MKKMMTLLAAASMAVAPTMAAAQAQPAVAPAEETVQGSELQGGFILPLVAVVAVIVAVLLLTDDDEEEGTTP